MHFRHNLHEMENKLELFCTAFCMFSFEDELLKLIDEFLSFSFFVYIFLIMCLKY